MRPYGLVCMASTALTVFVGHASLWYGGRRAVAADPTRVVQGVVTGIGFLGAGVIMKDGLSISGLTTAASIWAASAIGVLLGVGFYAAALLLALLCMLSMSLPHRLEAQLPGRSTLEVCPDLRLGGPPTFEELAGVAEARGYRVLHDSLRITFADSLPVGGFAWSRWTGRAPRRRSCWRRRWPLGRRDQLQHRPGAQLRPVACIAVTGRSMARVFVLGLPGHWANVCCDRPSPPATKSPCSCAIRPSCPPELSSRIGVRRGVPAIDTPGHRRSGAGR